MFNFDELTNRKGSHCYKWDTHPDETQIPMWIADMDFKTAPPIVETLINRVNHGIFGYTKVPKEYFEAVCHWFETKHNWHFEPKEIIYTSGVVPAISTIIKAITTPGDKVLLTTPVYNCFFSSIRNNDCEVANTSLIHDNNGRFSIDFSDFENKCKDPKVTVFLLCNPHNPTSRVWTRDELTKMAKICKENNVFVISDEIHCEIMMPNFKYTPFGTLESSFLGSYAVCTSPSKAFNIAGLQIANIICNDLKIRKKIDRAININEVCDVNPFGVEALMTAYTNEDCYKWLTELNSYIYENFLLAKSILNQKLPSVKVTPLEGTYLMWADFGNLVENSHEFEVRLLKETGVWLNCGTLYGSDGEHYMRINLATQRKNVENGINILCNFLNS